MSFPKPITEKGVCVCVSVCQRYHFGFDQHFPLIHVGKVEHLDNNGGHKKGLLRSYLAVSAILRQLFKN